MTVQGDLVLAQANGVGHRLELLNAQGEPLFNAVHLMGLHDTAPLMPFAPSGHERVWPGGRGFEPTLTLPPGVWACTSLKRRSHFLVATVDDVREVTRAQAFCALGAVEALQALDLHDAAVSLLSGDYDNAATQWIADRDRRRGL